MHCDELGESDGSKVKEEKMSSNSEIVDAVMEVVAASTFAKY